MDIKLNVKSDDTMMDQSRGEKSLKTCDLATKQEEIQETPDMIENSLQTLREMLENEKSLNSRTDKEFLLWFLRARKFDCNQTFVLLKNYYLLRIKYPEVYEKCRPSEILNAFKTKTQIIIPKVDQFGRGIVIFNLGTLDASVCPLEDQLRLLEFLLALVMRNEEVQKHGVISIINFENFGFYQFKDIRPSHIKYCISAVQNSFPVRCKAFHVVNEKYYTRVLYNLILPFLTEKIKRRVHFHGSNMEALHKQIDPIYLPEEYGGTLPESELNFLEEESLKIDDDFVEDAKYGFK